MVARTMGGWVLEGLHLEVEAEEVRIRVEVEVAAQTMVAVVGEVQNSGAAEVAEVAAVLKLEEAEEEVLLAEVVVVEMGAEVEVVLRMVAEVAGVYYSEVVV